jgi:hypothetical protein
VGVSFEKTERECSLKLSLPLCFVLSRQVSNLNSSDPESDVLPITPRDNFRGANIEKFLQNSNMIEILLLNLKGERSEV